MRVTKENAVEFAPDKFVIGAFDLGIPVGRIYGSLVTDLGNQRPFVRTDILKDGSVEYKQLRGNITLVVLND